jgi:uncharacterized membrane protein YfcA
MCALLCVVGQLYKDDLVHVAAIVVAGGIIGLLIGMFGVGGSVATPLLSLVGVSPFAAVASALPATIPGSLLGARPYVKSGEARPKAAGWSLLGAVPSTILGAYFSKAVGGPALLVLSGLMLAVAGIRVVLPITDEHRERGTARRLNRPLLVSATFCAGFVAGLLANGGGFLLMPMYLLFFGLRMRQSVGTALLVASVLSIPSLVVHAALGHVNWAVSLPFAIGLLPMSVVGGHYSARFATGKQRQFFGVFLVVFGIFFTIYRLAI